MRLVRYSPGMFPLLKTVTPSGSGLSHEPFVNYYYATRDECVLHVLLDRSGTAVGTVGIERMPFAYEGGLRTIAFASNLLATVPAVGGQLYLQWMKSASMAMVFGGSPDTHRILRAQKWTYYPGVITYRLNWPYPVQAGEALANRLVKAALRRTQTRIDLTRRMDAIGANSVSVREERGYRDEMTAIDSVFTFRLAPDLAYLRWRYPLQCSFARYRVATVHDGPALIGYVVLRDRGDHLIVAHADGTNARLLAIGMVKAVADLSTGRRRCGAMMTSSHPEMQEVFEAAGFVRRRAERPLALGSLRGPVTLGPDTRSWMVSYDWGDNSLRPPFDDSPHLEH